MSRAVLPLLSVLVICSAVLAGCVGEGDEVVDPPAIGDGEDTLIAADGRDLRTELTAEDEVTAPKWVVGEAFGVHLFLGPDDQEGEHLDAVVVEASASGYTLAPTDKETAKFDAVFDVPIFGGISADHLTMEGFGGTWKLYDFPLSHEKTWTSTITVPSFDSFSSSSHELTFSARYASNIVTPDGPRPGFEIEGVTAEGDVLIRTDYVPAIGWNAHFYLYDLNSDDPADFLFHTMSMGHSMNWTGTYYVSTANALVAAEAVVAMDPEDPSGARVEPSPHHPFTMAEASTYLFGFAYAGGFTGASEVLLVDPAGNTHETQVVAQPMAFAMAFTWFDQAAVPGDWQAVMGGAGLVSFTGLYLWEIVETAMEL